MTPAAGRAGAHPHADARAATPACVLSGLRALRQLRRLVGLHVLVVLLLLVGACTDGTGVPTPADGGAVLDLPAPAAPTPVTPVASDEQPSDDAELPTPPVPDVRRGSVVLVHLEGPVTDASATDVVVRDENGTELDRFRLAGAVDVHAGPGSRWALIETFDGQWARYDATNGALSLVTFEGDPPVGPPRLEGPLALWEDPARPWVLRLDTAVASSLRPQIGEGGSVVAVGPQGTHVLVRGERDHVVDTTDGSVRTLPAQQSISLSFDGTTIVSTAPGTTGTDVYLEAVDGSGRRLVATVPAPGVPVVMADGQVVVLGTVSQLVQPDGTLTPLLPVAGAEAPLLVADGTRIVVPGDAGLVVVDPAGRTVVTVPNSVGYVPFGGLPVDGVARGDGASGEGGGALVWAASESGEEPGATVVDAEAGTSTAVLPDVETDAITSISADGQAVTLQVGEGGAMAVLARADGSTLELGQGAVSAEAVVHPRAEVVAVAVVADATRTLRLVGVQGGGEVRPGAEIPTGRSPRWVYTDP